MSVMLLNGFTPIVEDAAPFRAFPKMEKESHHTLVSRYLIDDKKEQDVIEKSLLILGLYLLC